MIRILLVDDLASIREIFRDSLAVESDFEIVGTAENGFEAILKVEQLVPDVVLMDVEMPKMDGIEATRILSQRGFRAKVLILTSHEREEYFERATQAGAKGYLLKTTPTPDLVRAIREAAQGNFHLPENLINKYLTTLVEAPRTYNELRELKEAIRTQLSQCQQLSRQSLEKSLYLERELQHCQKKMRAYFHSSQTALDSYSTITNQQQMQLKKSCLVLRRMVWGLTLSLVMMLSFGLAFGVTIWLKKS